MIVKHHTMYLLCGRILAVRLADIVETVLQFLYANHW